MAHARRRAAAKWQAGTPVLRHVQRHPSRTLATRTTRWPLSLPPARTDQPDPYRDRRRSHCQAIHALGGYFACSASAANAERVCRGRPDSWHGGLTNEPGPLPGSRNLANHGAPIDAYYATSRQAKVRYGSAHATDQLPDMPGLFTSCTAGSARRQARCHHPASPAVTGRPARAVPDADHRCSRHGARRRARRRRVPAREKIISQIPPSTAAVPSAAQVFRGADGPGGVLAGGRTARTC